MSIQAFPNLDPQSITVTREALHAYPLILGNCLKGCRPKPQTLLARQSSTVIN